MRSVVSKQNKKERGAVLVELAIFAPLILLIPIASVEISSVMKSYQVALAIQEYASQTIYRKCVFKLAYTATGEDRAKIAADTKKCMDAALAGVDETVTTLPTSRIDQLASTGVIDPSGQSIKLLNGRVDVVARIYRYSAELNTGTPTCWQITSAPSTPPIVASNILIGTNSCDITDNTTSIAKLLLPGVMMKTRRKVALIEAITTNNYFPSYFFKRSAYASRRFSIL